MYDSFATRLRDQAAARPDAPALTVVPASGEEVTYDYAELDRIARRAAHALADDGVGPGDRVAYLGANGIGFAALLHGASYLRATSLAVNWRLSPAEITGVLADAEPRVLVAAPGLAEAARDAAEHIEALRRVVVLAEPGPDELDPWLDGRAETPIDVAPEPDDLAMLCYTSGTTGAPKGVMVTDRAVHNHLRRPGAYPYLGPGTVMLDSAPVFHAAGAAWGSWIAPYHGAHGILLAQADPGTVLAALARHRVEAALLVPAVIQLMLDHPGIAEADLSRLRTVVYGASPITEALLTRAMRAFPSSGFVQAYGMTETTGPITRLDPDGHRAGSARLRSAGRPYDGIEVKTVVPGTDRDCAPGEPGEVWTRSDQNCPGYWRNPEATAGLLTADGWLHTGDAGHMDADGWLYLTDRVKDMIVSGGENVYAGEVENVLARCPGVRDVCVVGVPHRRWGETVKAVVVAADDGPSADGLIAFARERLAHYKCPTSVDFATELPRNAAGKVLRRMVREPYWEDGPRRRVT